MWNSTFVGNEENTEDSIEPGKYADMVAFDIDPLNLSPKEMKDITFLMTIVDEKIVY